MQEDERFEMPDLEAAYDHAAQVLGRRACPAAAGHGGRAEAEAGCGMTELHNMSVPPRSVLTVQREELHGRRYRVAIGASAMGRGRLVERRGADAMLPGGRRRLRAGGAQSAHRRATTGEFRKRDRRVSSRREHARHAAAALRYRAQRASDLPDGFGFFVDETPGPGLVTVSAAAAIAILAARSGPLYLPGRFEPSLITAGARHAVLSLARENRGASMNDLTARVLNAIPAGAFEMNALLSLLRIEETDAVPTASVSCERRPVLRINPDFVRRHCRTDEHLFLLVMHELHHVLLGHTRLFRRATRAHNLAFDALINSMLVLRFPAEAYRSFFLDLYGAEDGPAAVARPSGGPRDHGRRAAPPPSPPLRGREDDVGGSLQRRHRRAGACRDRTCGAPPRSCSGRTRTTKAAGGGPRDRLTRRSSARSGTSSRSGRRRSRRFAAGVSRTRCRARTSHRTGPASSVLATLRRALLGAATKRTRGSRERVAGRVGPGRRAERVRPPRGGRAQRRVHSRSCTGGRRRCARGRAGRARVYIDVSGSMAPYVPFLYGALVALRRYVERDVLLFSTTVTSIALADLQRGRVDTTGGTDIRCVIEHALTHRVRKVLIVTDGYVGRPTPAAGGGNPAGGRGSPCRADTRRMAAGSGRDVGADGRTAGASRRRRPPGGHHERTPAIRRGGL